MATVRCAGLLCLALATVPLLAAPPQTRIIHPLGPGEFPDHLKGTWKISLCCRPYHAWIRYENARTGEVHTLARFKKGSGDAPDPEDGTSLPKVHCDGLWWDQDLRHEGSVRCGRCTLLSVQVRDPAVYMGADGGQGYCIIGNNCTNYAAEAWHFYSGEWFPVRGLIGLPKTFAADVARCHPGLPLCHILGPE